MFVVREFFEILGDVSELLIKHARFVVCELPAHKPRLGGVMNIVCDGRERPVKFSTYGE